MRNNDKKGGSRGRGQGGAKPKTYFSPEERENDKPERTSRGRDEGASRSRKPFGKDADRDRPKRERGSDEERGERKSFSRESAREKPVRRDDDKGAGRKRESSSNDDRGERRSSGRESDRDKPARRDDDKKFGRKRESSSRDDRSERKSFSRESDREKPARRDDDKGFGRKRESSSKDDRGERKSFRRESDREKPVRRTGSRDDDRSYTKKREDSNDDRGERKSFRRDDDKRTGGSYGERKGRSSFDKKKSYGDDRKSSSGKKDVRSWDDESGKKEKRTTGKSSGKSSGSKRSGDDEAGLVRLNKYISNAGICSRREADDLIKSGVVSVNGKVITEMGYKVRPEDFVKYNNETLKKERMVYVLLNKPKDYITTADDPSGRKTVLELVQGAGRERIYPVGRLDRATTGVLLLTNDGELTKRLTHPRYGVQKIYHVELDKNVKSSDIDKIKDGIELEDGTIKADDVAYVGDGQDKAQIGVELHSGRNRIVRRIFEHLGYNVRKLDRVVFAGLTKKDLPRGRWRHLTEKEVGMLYMISSKEK